MGYLSLCEIFGSLYLIHMQDDVLSTLNDFLKFSSSIASGITRTSTDMMIDSEILASNADVTPVFVQLHTCV